MALRPAALAAILSSLLSGCPEAHGSRDASAFLAEVARLQCEQTMRCAAPARVNAWRSAAPDLACTDIWAWTTAAVSPERVRFDPSGADACLARVATACSSPPLPAFCPGVIEGLGVDGSPCVDDLECRSDFYCALEGRCDGLCRLRPTSGVCDVGCASCDDPGAGGESTCEPAPPVTEAGTGEPCAGTAGYVVCPPMHYCFETCRPYPGEGESCGEYWPVCAPGLGCSGGRCLPTQVAALGEDCDDELVFCDRFHGAVCEFGRCVPLGGCDPAWSDVDCERGEICDSRSRTCVPAAPDPCRP